MSGHGEEVNTQLIDIDWYFTHRLGRVAMAGNAMFSG